MPLKRGARRSDPEGLTGRDPDRKSCVSLEHSGSPLVNTQAQKRFRATVFARLLLILAGVAALPTVIVMLVQERALVRDLEGAAAGRLERARHAAGRLLDAHLAGTADRYRAISGTPQFRATLELGDAATLRFYADEVARREGAEAIGFVDASGAMVRGGSQPDLLDLPHAETADLFERAGRLYTRIEIPLKTGAERVGDLLAVEALSEPQLAEWSDTCGAAVAFERDPASRQEDLSLPIRRIGEGQLIVAYSLEDERRALAHARRNLLAAGGFALTLAFAASALLSRSWVRPILQIKDAAGRIGRGDFEARIASRRSDEIGDVARAFDEMTVRLREYDGEVGRHRQALETKVRELRDSQERLQNAQRLARMGSWRFDLRTGEMELSPELLDILGLPSSRGIFRLKDLMARVHPDDVADVEKAGRMFIQERSSLHIDHRIVHEDGSERVLQTQARFVPSAGDLLEGTAQDITERKRTEEQIRFLAYNDGLTGLGNRRLFHERLDLAIAEGRRSQRSLGILFIDLDHFKRINDTLGHSVGDQLLRGVADRMVASVRDSDLVARAELPTAVSRFGGDEFTILVSGIDHARDLARVARRLLLALSQPFTLEGHDIVIAASIGVAVWPTDGENGEMLLRNADAAMNHAKEQGRNNYQFYAAAMNEEALQRLILESRIRRAIEQDEFEVHYQPKLDQDGRRLRGVEALARWRDPELGVVLPGEFIPIAEETGLIGALGEWVLRRACSDRQRWTREGIEAFPVAVNLSAHQFREGRLAERVLEVLGATGLDPKLLELEITESTLLHDERTVIAALQELRAVGVRVAVDDFGTGYSSLAYLRRLPVDALKIDRRFVRSIADEPGEAALASAIVTMGHALELRVVAEGVETQEQCALLQEWNCDELQGFLFARPMPDRALLAWCDERGVL
jgi:diguanylate cyclase (GGDEF)-like protein